MADSKGSRGGIPEYTSDQAVAAIQQMIAEGNELSPSDKLAIDSWRLLVRPVLQRAFGKNAPIVSQVMNAGPQQIRSSFDNPARVARRQSERHQAMLAQLAASIRVLQLPAGMNRERIVAPADTSAVAARERTIFLVHGRADAVKLEVARFVEKHCRTPVTILHEQPNAGRTLIEKLEHYSDASFAIVRSPATTWVVCSRTSPRCSVRELGRTLYWSWAISPLGSAAPVSAR